MFCTPSCYATTAPSYGMQFTAITSLHNQLNTNTRNGLKTFLPQQLTNPEAATDENFSSQFGISSVISIFLDKPSKALQRALSWLPLGTHAPMVTSVCALYFRSELTIPAPSERLENETVPSFEVEHGTNKNFTLHMVWGGGGL